MSIEEQLRSLTKNEVTVLYYKCKGLKYDLIAGRLGYSTDWVQLQMSTVYAKLGFSKEMHWTKRRDILEKEVCPLLPKDLKDWEFKEEIREEVKATEEPQTQPRPNPEMLALVLYDEKQNEVLYKEEIKEEGKKPSVIVVPTQPRPTPLIVRLIRYVIFAIVVCGFVSAVGYFAYTLGRESLPQTSVTDQAMPSELPQTPLLSPTPPLVPTIVSTEAIADTPLPSNTETATNTQVPDSAFFDDFADGLDPAWNVEFGSTSIVNEQLTTSEGALLSIGDISWKNYTVEFRVIPDACWFSSNQIPDAIGVRASDSSNMIQFAFGNCQSVWLHLIDGTQKLIPNSEADGISRNNNVRIVVQDNKMSVYENLELVGSIIDENFQSGKIYLQMHRNSIYDNFKVTLSP